MIELIEMNDISDDVIIERLTAVKSASLTTLVYFSLRYFRNRKPLSSISPVLVFVMCLTFFGTLADIRADTNIVDWYEYVFFFGLTFVLFRLHSSDSKKLFGKDW